MRGKSGRGGAVVKSPHLGLSPKEGVEISKQQKNNKVSKGVKLKQMKKKKKKGQNKTSLEISTLNLEWNKTAN